MTPIVVNSGDEARQKVLDLIPEGSEVFTATSATLTATGIAQQINESGRYVSVRKAMSAMNRETQFLDMRRVASTPKLVVGSVHAITEQGYGGLIRRKPAPRLCLRRRQSDLGRGNS